MNIGYESEILEFKKSTSELKAAVISIASIMNKHNSGTLYFGVRDDGKVIGQEVGKETQRDISRALSSYIMPDFRYEIELKHTVDDLDFIEVSFSGGNPPYSAYGRYYQRYADEDKQMTDTELEAMFRARMKDYSEWENARSDETPDDIDEELLKQLIRDGNDSGHLDYEYKDKVSALGKFGLLAADGEHLDNAGKVLLSSNKPVMLKTATFATRTRETFIKLDHYMGNVFECVEKGVDYITEGIDYIVEFDGGITRKERPEIPRNSIREIVLNAFTHGCYDSNTAFQIEIYKDRVSIYSPGHFPRGYTPEDFAEKAVNPILLNPKIADAMFRFGRIESFGTGFEKTFSECKAAGVPYRYRELNTGFEFTFERTVNQNNVSEISDTETAVLTEIKEDETVTAKELADKLSKSTKTIYRAISCLKQEGLIVREGSDYNGKWKYTGGDSKDKFIMK